MLLGELTGCQLTGGVRLRVLNKLTFETDIDHERSTWSALTWRETRAGTEIVSTNQLEPPPYPPPPTMNPRARTLARAGMLKPPTRQPPATGKPAPALTQSAPSAEKSKLVRETSGLVPPLSQVMVEPSWFRLSVGASVLLNRPSADRRSPPSIPNQPPARIFPSGCTASSSTVLSVGPGLKPLSSVPSEFSRAIIVL